MYLDENDDNHPREWNNWRNASNQARGYWYNQLLGQGMNGTVEVKTTGGAGPCYIGGPDTLRCPSGSFSGWNMGTTKVSYGMASLTLWRIKNSSGNPLNCALVTKFFTRRLLAPEAWPLFMDADTGAQYSLDNPVPSETDKAKRFAARHNDRANVMMVAGQVTTVPWGSRVFHQATLNVSPSLYR